MDIIWAPWRGNYIKMGFFEKECIFCYFDNHRIEDIEPNFDNLILYRSTRSFIIMNKYPYINGHLMVVPYRHIDDLLLLDNHEKSDIFDMIQFSVEILKEVYNPHGFNIGINIGKVAGAGVDKHIHFHVVPRFNADHNFISTISNSRLINFSLRETYDDLLNVINKKEMRD
ncbi:MAG: HIT domain-containing protein [bacterium]|nr:HIT domain-containing protein [bacterium]